MKKLLFLALIGQALGAWAQTPASRTFSWHLSYMANNALYPGINAGIEYGLLDKVNLVTRSRKGSSHHYVKVHQLILAGNLGLIWHPHTSTTLLNAYTIEYRKTTKRRMQFQIGTGPAYLRSFLPNVYEVTEDGEAEKRFLAGRGYFAHQFFLGFGRYRLGARSLQWWHVRLVENTVIGYNNSVLPYPVLELRLGFHKKPIG